MREVKTVSGLSKPAAYAELHEQLAAMLQGERNGIANAANMSALLYQSLPDINWVGFYLLLENELVLGPFQGKVACVRIPLGRGVCGSAAKSRETIIVPDVHAFPGHIACDRSSQSEIVIPLLRNGRLLGVLDVDSPAISRFDEEDAGGLRTAAAIFLDASDL
jgi:L-methionine (R)-S-oxide reductase